MFDQVKVNQNNIINLIKIPERENVDILPKKTGNDFFAMIMEKSGFDNSIIKTDNKLNQIDKPEHTNEKNVSPKLDQNIASSDNSRIAGRIERDDNLSSKEKGTAKNPEMNGAKEKTKEELKSESKNGEINKNSEISTKEAKAKKTDNKNIEDENSIINHILGESNIRNLMEIIKASFSGNKKAEEESFQKLFSNLKFKNDKDNANLRFSSRKNDSEKNHKSNPEMFTSIIKDLKESIGKEIFKNIDNRKSGSKPVVLTDKELKELASSIIDGIKKNKAKDIVKHEAKIAAADEVKNEKKPVVSVEQQSLKKVEMPDESSFERNGSKDKHSGKDSFSFNGGKIDFSARTGLEKMEHTLKMSDFKENLQEIIDKAKVTVRDGKNGTFTMKLNPQELGNVNVNLIMENGVITGKFLVDNEDVKSMLLNSLNDLKNQLEEAGISFGEFSVNVNDQHEKYLKQKDDERVKSLSFMNADRDVIAAADQYNSNATAQTGHINMVI